MALANPYPFAFSPRPDALPQIKYGMLATGNLFRAMSGRDAVIVLGHDFWMQEVSGDRSVVARATLIRRRQ